MDGEGLRFAIADFVWWFWFDGGLQFWEYYASTAIKMRNVRYLLASENVMWYNCFIRGIGKALAFRRRI